MRNMVTIVTIQQMYITVKFVKYCRAGMGVCDFLFIFAA